MDNQEMRALDRLTANQNGFKYQRIGTLAAGGPSFCAGASEQVGVSAPNQTKDL